MSSFCKSYSHFFSKNFQRICVSLNVNFNELLTNKIVSFEQLGPVVCLWVLQFPPPCNINTLLFWLELFNGIQYLLKAPYSSKIYSFNKLIYGISKMWHLAACEISVSLSILNWNKNEMIFFIVSLN